MQLREPFEDCEVSAWWVLFVLFSFLVMTFICINQDSTIHRQRDVIRQCAVKVTRT